MVIGVEATAQLIPSTQEPREQEQRARLVGLDVARGLAVLGMFAVHVMSPTDWPSALASGRAAVLFAVLAGVSIALLSGGSQPFAGTRMRFSRVRIAVRAVLLFLLGVGLATLQVPAMVILAFYGVLFLLSIPVLRLRAGTLAILAAVLAVGAPVLSFVLRGGSETNRLGYTPNFGDFGSLDGLWTVLHSLLLTGAYPVLTWLPFLLTGMALGRLDLLAVRAELIAVGSGLAVLGYGGSWVAMHPLGGQEVLLSTLPPGLPPKLLDVVLSSSMGTTPTTSPVWLLTAGAHSGTPFEIVGASGVAIAVIGICLYGQRLRRPLLPISSVGALALTSYAGHLLVLKAFGTERMAQLAAEHSYAPWLVLMAGTVLVTTAWRAFLGRGPLERALHHASTAPARLLAR